MADETEQPDYAPIFKRLAEYYDVGESLQWMNFPHPLLGGEVPADLMKQGRADEVHAILNQLEDCVYI